jgi:hypothetical protein
VTRFTPLAFEAMDIGVTRALEWRDDERERPARVARGVQERFTVDALRSVMLLVATARLERRTKFGESLPRHDAPKLTAQPLRATWVVGDFDARVRQGVVDDAARVNTETVCIYGAAMSRVDAAEDDAFLRGGRP